MGWKSALGKIGKIAAITGASMVGSPALGAAVAGGLGALENRKKGLKGMLGGAALGAGTSFIPGGGAASGVKAGIGAAAKQTAGSVAKATAASLLKNPQTYASLLGGLGSAGQVAGATSAGRAQGRAQESQLLDARDRTATDRYQAEQGAQNQAAGLDLQRKNFMEGARGSRAKQAAIADMLANFKGTQINIPGIQSATTTGGMNVGSPGMQQSMAKLREQALLAQLQGDSPGGENFQGGKQLTPAAMSGVPQETGYDKLLNVGAGIGNMAGAMGPAFEALLERKQYDVAPQQALPEAMAGLSELPGVDVGLPQAPPDPRAALLANQKRLMGNVSL